MDDVNGALNSSLPYVATRYRAAALEAVLSTKICRLKIRVGDYINVYPRFFFRVLSTEPGRAPPAPPAPETGPRWESFGRAGPGSAGFPGRGSAFRRKLNFRVSSRFGTEPKIIFSWIESRDFS